MIVNSIRQNFMNYAPERIRLHVKISSSVENIANLGRHSGNRGILSSESDRKYTRRYAHQNLLNYRFPHNLDAQTNFRVDTRFV